MTVPHFSFFPCIWVMPCLLLSIRTCDLAVQKLLNTEKSFQVPLVYSYFSTCKHRGRLGITNKDTRNVVTYSKLQQPRCRHREEVLCALTALQVSLGSNLALRVSGQEACDSDRMGFPAPLSQTG